MKIGLIKCDSVKPELQGYCGDYGQMFLGAFVPVVPQINMLTFNVRAGVYPIDLDECDAYIIVGSESSVYDEADWLEELKEFIRECHDLEIKLVGICFGHQLIAESLGGKVASSQSGWVIGAEVAQMYEPARWMKPMTEKCTLFYSHRDQVIELPTGAVLHAGSKSCKNAIYSIADNVFSIQGHPEYTMEYAHALIHDHRAVISAGMFNTALQSLSLKPNQAAIMRWIAKFISDK